MSEAPTNQGRGKEELPGGKDLATLIAEHPFLCGLKPAHLRMLEDNAMVVSYAPGELIFRAGDPANRFYLILRGRVSLESARPAVSIQSLGVGDVLGWSWLFPPYVWHFAARAVEPTVAVFLYGTRLREACEGDPELGYELMKRVVAVIIDRLQATRQQLVAARQPAGEPGSGETSSHPTAARG